MTLFSQRNAPTPDHYRYTIDERVRNRLMLVLRKAAGKDDFRDGFTRFLIEMGELLEARYGGLRSSSFEAVRVNNNPVVEHLFRCRNEEVIDFLVFAFQTEGRCGRQETVQALNEVLSQEHIGYELTAFVTEYEHRKTSGRFLIGGKYEPQVTREEFPKAIKKSEQLLHGGTVLPALAALCDQRFATASGELLKAFGEYDKGEYADAITDAGSAYESVLKIICTCKRWQFDKDRDTCSKLLDVCRDNSLFHGFYRPILESVASIRNKVGDAHGKGTKAEYPATKELADHMLYMVCNNINLLITLAKL